MVNWYEQEQLVHSIYVACADLTSLVVKDSTADNTLNRASSCFL